MRPEEPGDRIRTTSAVLLAACLIAALPARTSAQAPSQADGADIRLGLTLENDLFFGTDRYYTNGFQLWYERSAPDPAGALLGLAGAMCRWTGCPAEAPGTIHHRLGQLMYTPSRIDVPGPQQNDRPWAGMLYYTYGASVGTESSRSITSTLLLLGVIGPWSGAAQAQRLVHDMIGATEPLGWDNQIGSFPAVNLTVEHRRGLHSLNSGPTGIALNTTGYGRVGAGTVMTFAEVGVAFTLSGPAVTTSRRDAGDIGLKRAGLAPMGLPADGASGRVDAAGRQDCFVTSVVRCVVRLSIEGRWVIHNAFLEGRPFSSGYGLDVSRAVADAVLSFAIAIPQTRSLGLGTTTVSFSAAMRTPEFSSAEGRASAARFGTLSIGFEF